MTFKYKTSVSHSIPITHPPSVSALFFYLKISKSTKKKVYEKIDVDLEVRLSVRKSNKFMSKLP